jgi:FAD/FMN-containing dehydrogenase
MTKILNVDAADSTMTVVAGATLKSVQDAPTMRAFVSLRIAGGSCRIGGNLSTNAGGKACLLAMRKCVWD